MDAFCFTFFWTFQAVLMLRTAVSELRLFPAINNTKIPHSFLHLLLSLQGYLGPLCSVVGVGIPLASIPRPPFRSSFLCELICVWDFACYVYICKPVCLSAFPCLPALRRLRQQTLESRQARLGYVKAKAKTKQSEAKTDFLGLEG